MSGGEQPVKVTEFDKARQLEREGDHAGAEAAYRAGEAAGDPRCATFLGIMFGMRGEIDEAEAAFRRGEQGGDPNGAYNLGILLENERRDLAGATDAWRRADAAGPRSR